MPRNYDTTVGLPWPRISRITIELDEEGNAAAEYVERMAVTVNGASRHLAEPATYHRIHVAASEMLDPSPMVDPVTGADIGENTTPRALYMTVLALVRAHQKSRDAA